MPSAEGGEEQRADDRDPQGAGEQPGEEDRDREREVELLLHRQRPGVQQHAGAGLVAEVVDVLGAPEEEVRHETRGSRGRSRRLLLGAGGCGDEVAEDQHPDQHRGLGRDQAARATGVERAPPDAARLGVLVHEQPGDDVAGDDEEEVEADVGALEAGHLRVEAHHHDGGRSADAVDVGAVLRTGLLRRARCGRLGLGRGGRRRRGVPAGSPTGLVRRALRRQGRRAQDRSPLVHSVLRARRRPLGVTSMRRTACSA